MKLRSVFYGMLCMLALGTATVACSDDDDNDDNNHNDTGSKVELPRVRAFFLNEGSYPNNNAGLAFYAPNNDAAFIRDIFSYQNDKQLGMTGQSMIEYDDHIYIAVYGSNYLTKLNAAGVEQANVSFTADPDLGGGVRYLAADDGYIYASFWGGVVAKINAKTLAVEKKLTGLGGNLEGVAECNGMLYVCNSCSADWSTYYTEVKVIDLRSFTLRETVTVTMNPNAILEEDDKIFLISWGNYYDIGYTLQMIDPAANNQVTDLGSATRMAANDDVLYLAYSYYTNPTNSFFTYNIKTRQLNTASFLKSGAPDELYTSTIYMLEIDDNNGDIYIGTTDYTNNGNIYRFRQDGTFLVKFDAGGINPNSAVFFD